jgi:hypothetical protein
VKIICFDFFPHLTKEAETKIKKAILMWLELKTRISSL